MCTLLNHYCFDYVEFIFIFLVLLPLLMNDSNRHEKLSLWSSPLLKNYNPPCLIFEGRSSFLNTFSNCLVLLCPCPYLPLGGGVFHFPSQGTLPFLFPPLLLRQLVGGISPSFPSLLSLPRQINSPPPRHMWYRN